jgi:hypothetical protein
LDKLLTAKKENDCCNQFVHARAWVFFEKKRILDGHPKSAEREQTEIDHPQGLSVPQVVLTTTPAVVPTRVIARRGHRGV